MRAPRRRPFRQVDVFGQEPYRGNALAVVHDAEGLSTAEMAAFASWTNLAETAFLLPPTAPGADYRVRIFTPSLELPFAGHPTLGSCHAWLEHGGVPAAADVIVQECGAGLVRVRRDGERLAFAEPPLVRGGPVEPDVVAAAAGELGLDPAAIVAAQWADNGPSWVALLLGSAAEVLALRPGIVTRDIGVVGPTPPGSDEAFELRAFVPEASGTVEDPVTGSLNAAVAGWLIRSGRAPDRYVARQGTALGRAGRIHVERDADGVIWIGGASATCIVGEVVL